MNGVTEPENGNRSSRTDAVFRVEPLALDHPEIVLSQTWITTHEAAAIGSYVTGESVSESTVRRHAREGADAAAGIRIEQAEGGAYLIHLGDTIRVRRAQLEMQLSRLAEIEEIRRRALE